MAEDDQDERDRTAFAAMVAYRRVMSPRLSQESVRRLWELRAEERAAWRAVVDTVMGTRRSGDKGTGT